MDNLGELEKLARRLSGQLSLAADYDESNLAALRVNISFSRTKCIRALTEALELTRKADPVRFDTNLGAYLDVIRDASGLYVSEDIEKAYRVIRRLSPNLDLGRDPEPPYDSFLDSDKGFGIGATDFEAANTRTNAFIEMLRAVCMIYVAVERQESKDLKRWEKWAPGERLKDLERINKVLKSMTRRSLLSDEEEEALMNMLRTVGDTGIPQPKYARPGRPRNKTKAVVQQTLVRELRNIGLSEMFTDKHLAVFAIGIAASELYYLNFDAVRNTVVDDGFLAESSAFDLPWMT